MIKGKTLDLLDCLIEIKNSLVTANTRIIVGAGREISFGEVIKMFDLYLNRMVAKSGTRQVDR